MLSSTEQYLYSTFKNWLTFYLINNFIHLLKFYHLNLTYSHTITIMKPTFLKQTLTKYTKRQIKTIFKNLNQLTTNFYKFLNITNALFIWLKPLTIKNIENNVLGLLTLNKYFIKPNQWVKFNTIYKNLFNFFFINLKSPIWFTQYKLIKSKHLLT